MYKKLSIPLKTLFITFLLLVFSFSLVACQLSPNTKEKSPVFQEIAQYIQENGDKKVIGYLNKYQLDNYIYKINNPSEEDDIENGFIYNPKLDILALYSMFQNFLSAVLISNIDDYSAYTFTVVGYHKLDLSNITKFQCRLAMPAIPFKDLNTTIDLPAFQYKDDTIKKNERKYHSILSYQLNQAFTNFDNFYVKQIKNDNDSFINIIYQHFHLPVIKVELN